MSDKIAKLNDIDKRLLSLLAADGRISNQQLAEAVNLSPSPCARRVKRLEDEGFIRCYSARLHPEKLGYALSVYVAVTLDRHTQEHFRRFEEAVAAFPEVVRMSIVTGRAEDYLLLVVARDMRAFEEFLLGRLSRLPGVANVHSSFEMRRVIDREPPP